MLMIIVWWTVSAREWFKGPKVNIEHQMLGREGNLVNGQDSNDSSSGSDVREDRVFEVKRAEELA